MILVTGGSSGIGNAIARGLIDSGARVAIISRRDPKDWELPPPPDWDADSNNICIDLANGDDGSSAIEQWLKTHGSALDALVTCAVDYASPSRHALAETSLTEWDRLFDVNAKGTFLIVRAVLPYLLARERALIVGLTSDVAIAPAPFRVGYAASKAAEHALLAGLAAEQEGGRINVVQMLPGKQVHTPGISRRRPADFDFSGYLNASAFAEPVCSLVHDLGAGLNGQVITVNCADA